MPGGSPFLSSPREQIWPIPPIFGLSTKGTLSLLRRALGIIKSFFCAASVVPAVERNKKTPSVNNKTCKRKVFPPLIGFSRRLHLG